MQPPSVSLPPGSTRREAYLLLKTCLVTNRFTTDTLATKCSRSLVFAHTHHTLHISSSSKVPSPETTLAQPADCPFPPSSKKRIRGFPAGLTLVSKAATTWPIQSGCRFTDLRTESQPCQHAVTCAAICVHASLRQGACGTHCESKPARTMLSHNCQRPARVSTWAALGRIMAAQERRAAGADHFEPRGEAGGSLGSGDASHHSHLRQLL